MQLTATFVEKERRLSLELNLFSDQFQTIGRAQTVHNNEAMAGGLWPVYKEKKN